jgi:hypothetical protein
MNSRHFFAVATRVAVLALVGFVARVDASVTKVEILKVEPKQLPPGVVGPGVGPYEHIFGLIHGELDPKDPKNAIITDIALAPRNARGKVEYVAQFSLVKPVDMGKSTGVLRYSVVNRGGGIAAASPEGHVTLVSGWQADLVSTATNITIKVPVAKNPDGTSITGPFELRFTDRGQTHNTVPLLIPRDQPSPYPPVSLDTSKASLVAITAETAEGVKTESTVIPPADWSFADCATTPFPGKPDPSHICLKNGFQPETMYELRYTAKDPLVLGVGLAATRDINSFFRYDAHDPSGTPNPIAGKIKWAISEGSSQSGAFLRLMLLLGFNQDEAGRKVWDGMNPHISARVIDLNRRFALPGGATLIRELGYEAASWWEDWNDTARGRGTSGLLDRCRATNTCPKIMETFGAAEMWGLRHSFSLVGTNAKADIPLPANVHRYYFPGVPHGGGAGGFDMQGTGRTAPGCELLLNPAPVAPMYRALQQAFVGWVTKDGPMPPNKYPSIAEGTLVAPTSATLGFPKIPGKPQPYDLQNPLLDYDLGPEFNYRDQSGVATQLGVVKQVLPQLVPRVDEDGNEIPGVKSPLQMAPLGTYTGWNVISSGVFKGQLCNNNGTAVGGYIPFAKTKAERVASGDPRPSLEERYRTHAGYVTAVTQATKTLVQQHYLLQGDADSIIDQAAKSDVLVERN